MLATLRQGNQVLNLILQLGVDSRSLQEAMESGLLSDLLQADCATIDRARFREVLGLQSLDLAQSRRHGTGPLERYKWLGRKFCFTSMDLTIDDELGDGRTGMSRTANKYLKIKVLRNIDSVALLRLQARTLLATHNTYDCEVLDRYGQTIGTLWRQTRETDQSWDFEFKDARFLTFDEADGGWTVVVYEIAPT